MITVFKIFENINIPEKGEYILINVPHSDIINAINNTRNEDVNDFYNFINNTIGIIAYYFDHFNPNKQKVEIFYDNIPNKLIEYFNKGEDNKYSLSFNSRYIVAFTKTKKELEEIIKAKKYNIL
jgi:hypothetical protein